MLTGGKTNADFIWYKIKIHTHTKTTFTEHVLSILYKHQYIWPNRIESRGKNKNTGDILYKEVISPTQTGVPVPKH